jgi:hypothetical protein
VRTRQAYVHRVWHAGALVKPAVQHKATIDEHPHAIIRLGEEAVQAGREEQLPAPAHREVVSGQPRRRRTLAPTEVDNAVVARERGRAGKVRVVPVLAHPVGEGDLAHALPAQRHPRQPGLLVELDADLVRTTRQREIDADLPVAAVLPLVNQQLAVDPQARAIVHAEEEAICARIEVQRAGPTGREAVGRDDRGR